MYRDTLYYALALAGSERELARQLRVTVGQVRRWLNGADDVPEQIFQDTIDVITAASPQAICRSRYFDFSSNPSARMKRITCSRP